MSKYYKPNHSTILYLNSSFNCIKSQSITLTRTSGGTGYTSTPTINIKTAPDDLGSGALATCSITGGVVNTPITMVSGGNNYNKLPIITLSGGGNPGVITDLTITTAGSGYISPPTISATGGGGSGFSATCVVSGGAITSVLITNGGSNYTSTPTINITPTNGGSGAVLTPTINVGSAAVLTPSFVKCFRYTWNIPDIIINDLAKISAINIVSTNFNTTTPYTFRLVGLQYDSRDSYFSDYGNPILSMAQNVNVCSYGSLGGSNFCIILTPQTIRQIQISVDDDLTTMNSGIAQNINFVIALEIEEYDPSYTQIGDVYGEASNRLKPMY